MIYTHLEIADLAREAASSAFDMAQDMDVPFPTSKTAGEFIVEIHAEECPWIGKEVQEAATREEREWGMCKTLYFHCVYNRHLQHLQAVA